MKKLLTFIVCFMFGLTFVYAYDYTVEINPDNEMVETGGEVHTTIFLSGVKPSLTDRLEKIDLDLVYDTNVFEFDYSTSELNSYLPSYGAVANQEFVIVDVNPTYGESGHTYTDPTTGKRYSLILGSEYIDGSSNSELQNNPFILLDGISFTVKDNVPDGTYKIGINPTYNGDQVTYSDVINVTVAEGVTDMFIHNCIISSYNKEHSASKIPTDTLTEAEYKSITNFECGNSENDEEFIYDITEVYNLINLKNMNFKNADLRLENVDLSKFPNLEKLSFESSTIESIDLSHNPKLTEVSLYTPEAKNLDFSNNLLLKKLYVSFDKTINLSKNTELEELEISCNCTSVDLTNNTKLRSLGESSTFGKISVSVNEKKSIPQTFKLPSHIKITKASCYADGKKIIIKDCVITGAKAGKDHVSAYYNYTINGESNSSYVLGESFDVKVEKGIVNPKTGVMNFVSILIVMALIGFVSYTAIRYNNTKTSLQ